MVEIDKEATRAAGEKIEEEKRIEIEKKKKNGINDITIRQKRQEAFLKSLEGGVSVLKASKAADIGSYMTIWRWRKDDEEFDNKVLAILDSRMMIVEDALFLNAAKGNLGAQIFWLKNRARKRWKDKFPEDINLNVKGGLAFNEFQNIKEMTENERKQYIGKLQEICGSGNNKSTDADQEENKG